MDNLILVGGGGHCKSVIDVAECAGYNIVGILDKPEEFQKEILGYYVIGADCDAVKYIDTCEFMISVGQVKSVALRIRLYHMLKDMNACLATVIAPLAHVSRHASIGEGSIVLNNAVVNADVRIGCNAIINTASVIEHEVKIGDFCHVSTGAIVNGNCRIGDRVFVGSQCVCKNGINICSDVIVGAGSTVLADICEAGVYAGSPAKRLR